MPNAGPLPVEVVRDLLALARALYSVFRDMGPGYNAQLLKARGIGAQLVLALEKAKQGGPGSFAHRSAWLISEDAIRDLGVLVAELPAKALVDVTGQRLLKKR